MPLSNSMLSYVTLIMILLNQYRFFCGCYTTSAFQLRQYSSYSSNHYQQSAALVVRNLNKPLPLIQRQLQIQQLSYYGTKKRYLVLSEKRSNYSQDADTIYALSSGGGGSVATALAVIRLSGPQSFNVLDQLMNCSQKNKIKQQKTPRTRYASLRNLYDPRDGSLLDQALVLTFQKPNSFTGEDVVELHCHGSRGVIQGVLDALAATASSRPSERGEFTQRAFENGKLNLLQVEALADLILSDTSLQRKQALKNLIGDKLSLLYNQWRIDLTKALAHAEAIIDFGDDEDLSSSSDDDDDDDGTVYEQQTQRAQKSVWGNVQQNISKLRMAMERHIHDNQRGEIIRQGVKVAIIGPVNAGKSSLLNILAKRDAAIVSPIAGTTRDVVEVIMDLGGVRCIVSDTAGIRDRTDDIIEQEGIRRARVAAKDAHVCVIVVDATDPSSVNTVQALVNNISTEAAVPSSEIERVQGISTATTNNNQPMVILVSNKIDLTANGHENSLNTANDIFYSTFTADSFPKLLRYNVSCTTGAGVDEFLNALTSLVFKRVSGGRSDESPSDHRRRGEDDDDDDETSTVITRARHRYHVQEAVEALKRFEVQSQQGLAAVDLAAEELRLAASELGRVVGAVDVEDVLDVLFADFCIGK